MYLSLMALLVVSINANGQKKTVFFIIERDANKINFESRLESQVLDKLNAKMFGQILPIDAPLMTKEMIEFSSILTGGKLSTNGGLVHFERGADGSISFTSDEGQHVVLKTEINSIHWVFDKEKAFKIASDLDASEVAFIEINTHNLTEDFNGNGDLNKQKSIEVSLSFTLITVKNRMLVHSFSKEKVTMGVLVSQAQRESLSYLFEQLIKSFKDGVKQ